MTVFNRDLKNLEPDFPLYVAVETAGVFLFVILGLIAMVLA